ncbi:hypothetical protein GQ61_02435 [Candidatus Nucleicultrix amoebiphila FS5]|jgi:RimJ/RimL family protein N-acetyltransferase|uniref:N-acetyltransferase domain-containing protein n=2 Tax=Candidatus Nucleicultrix TaxID=1509243 RepID=A0A1W6N3N5_9PROT|nr:hypothetical protein GQ61_02435 [Candidatus Nucleicultrix amoebiphila FS5]
MTMTFHSATLKDKDTIFEWLDNPHVQEFWDNSPQHRQDIENFMGGRQTRSPYFGGMNSYWVGLLDNHPYAFIITHEESEKTDPPEIYKPYISKTGKTFGIDFCIGSKNHLGKGLAAPTLKAFMHYFIKAVEPKTDIFYIDPFINNPRAIHVYQKAGFKIVSEFTQQGGFFDQSKGVLMIKEISSEQI